MEIQMNNFKIGDWVRDYPDRKPFQLKSEYFKGVTKRNDKWFSSLIPWQPKEGEWCWFWNKPLVQELRLGQFSNMHNDMYYTYTGHDFDNCKPFIGELPSFLKETK